MISLKSLYKAVTSHLVLGLKSAGQAGRKDGHEVGESRGVCDQQQLVRFQGVAHTGPGFGGAKGRGKWVLELAQPCL